MARAHIRQLRKRGVTLSAIAQAAGLGTSTVHELLHRRCQPTAATIAAVLRVHPADMRSPRIDAGGTRLRLRALHVMGHGSARLATATGVSDWTIRQIIDGEATTVSRRLRATVVEVYDQWWDKRAPERTPGERAAVTLARRRAIRGNWCPPAALDDDLLDAPGYKPRYGWRPATGTGVAHDISPAGRLNGGPHG
jgi:lambda repressor-like predicted transcriptional regulator